MVMTGDHCSLLRRGQGGKNENICKEFVLPDMSDEEDVDEKSHGRLLDAIACLDGDIRSVSTIARFSRYLVYLSFNNFKIKFASSGSVLPQLMSSLSKSVSNKQLKNNLKAFINNNKAVNVPAPKLIQEKAERVVEYSQTVKHLVRWDPVVKANRKAKQLLFPAEKVTQRMLDDHKVFQPVSKLDFAIAAVEARIHPDDQHRQGNFFTLNEERAFSEMTAEDAQSRRTQLMNRRRCVMQQVHKLRWQNKIKSKRFRRGQKKDKQKQMSTAIENMAVEDPQAVVDLMEETDKRRILERGRLRHTGGKKFARMAKVFSKYDDQRRLQLQDMLAQHKELTKKQDAASSSDSGDEDCEVAGTADLGSKNNAWMRSSQSAAREPLSEKCLDYLCVENTGDNGFKLTDQFWNVDRNICHGCKADDALLADGKVEESDVNGSVKVSQSVLKRIGSVGPDVDTMDAMDVGIDDGEKELSLSNEQTDTHEDDVSSPDHVSEEDGAQDESDVEGVIEEVGDDISGEVVDNSTRKDEMEECGRCEEQPTSNSVHNDITMTVAEAFEDDDVVQEFLEEKKRVTEEETEPDKSLFLPGWGSWTGPGITAKKGMVEKFTVRAEKIKRDDIAVSHCIISNKRNKNAEKHTLSVMPPHFSNVEKVKRMLSQPLGRDFNSEIAFKKNIAPCVVVRQAGKILPPIDDSSLVNKQKAARWLKDTSSGNVVLSLSGRSDRNCKRKRSKE